MNKYVIELRPDGKVVQEMICESDGKVSIGAKSIKYLEELNADYINEHFGQLQDEAYQRGYDKGYADKTNNDEVCKQIAKDIQDEAYQRGLSEGNDIGYKDGVKDGRNEAWDAAKKLFSTMADSDIEKAFPIEWNNGGFNALINLQPQEAIAKLKAYEEKQKAEDEIRVGDEVKWNSDLIVVTRLYKDGGFDWCDGVGEGGKAFHILEEHARKTGRRFDIQKILEEIKA